MGAAALLAGQLGFAFLSSIQEQSAIEQQVKDAQKELTRQQQEANLIAQEEKSDRARAADRQFASAMVALETAGGAGSQNEARFGAEIAGNAGLDLARIEGNRRREVSALQSEKRAVRQKGRGAIRRSQAQFLSSALGAGGQAFSLSEQNKAQEDEARRFMNMRSGLLGGGT